jgi:hypothetical protein
MSEPKPFASLSSGLLARKGAARPAMRPQGFGQVGNGLEDLGWNDMGGESPKPVDENEAPEALEAGIVEHPRAYHPTGLSPVDSPVHGQQAEIADRFAADDGEEEIDEDYDETAELYDPDAPFVSSEDSDEEEEEEDGEEAYELTMPVAFEPAPTPAPFAPKKQMALGAPPPEGFEPQAVEPEAFEPEAFDSEAFERVAFAPQEPVAVEPVAIAPELVAASGTVSAPEPRRTTRARSEPGQKGKAAFTLRLDPDRHLKLRLACAVDGRSAQMLVTAALDQLLATMPELQDMAAKANRKG